MTQYEAHLYMILYPNQSLVLSQLPPAEFVLRYSYGTTSHYEGKMIFAELDINYRNPYFPLDEALSELKPHEDGRPKASKYVSSYRILEHVELDAIQQVFLCNADGTFMAIEAGPYTPPPEGRADIKEDFNIFVEVTPLTTIVLSRLHMRDFGKWMTGGNKFLSVPRLFYLEMNFDLNSFLERFRDNPFVPSPIVGIHPSKLRDAILDLKAKPDQFTKALTLHNALTKQSYRSITTGLMFMDKDHEKFFPMPSLDKIEEKNYPFFKEM